MACWDGVGLEGILYPSWIHLVAVILYCFCTVCCCEFARCHPIEMGMDQNISKPMTFECKLGINI